MGSLVPRLTLFPTYSGGPRIEGGGLNAGSSFRLPRTEFTPAYGVNLPPSTNRTDDNYFFRANANQTLSQVPISQADAFSQALAFNPGSTGSIQSVTPLSVVEAPQSPNKYADYIRALEVSDMRMSDLMAQPSFRLSQIGPGYRVTTDGTGHVASINVDPSVQALSGRLGSNDPGYFMLNRAEITQRAVLRSAVTPADTGQIPKPGSRPSLQTPGLEGAEEIFKLGRPELDGTALFPRAGLQPQGGVNPVLNRLLQLQPQNPGLAVAGIASEVDANAARQIAASQAKLDINLGPAFQENLASLQTATIQQGKIYGPTPTPQMLARQMDGLVNTFPSLPGPLRSSVESGLGYALPDFRDTTGGLSDAISKRGSDGYLPFSFSAGTGGGQGEPSMTGQGNPFARGFEGQSGQHGQPGHRRKPLSYQA